MVTKTYQPAYLGDSSDSSDSNDPSDSSDSSDSCDRSDPSPFFSKNLFSKKKNLQENFFHKNKIHKKIHKINVTKYLWLPKKCFHNKFSLIYFFAQLIFFIIFF